MGLVQSQPCPTITTNCRKISWHLKVTLQPVSVTLYPSLFPAPCKIWAFHLNSTIQHVAFFNWLLSFIIMSSRLIHVVPCVSTSFFFSSNIPFYGHAAVYLFISFWKFELFSFIILLFVFYVFCLCINITLFFHYCLFLSWIDIYYFKILLLLCFYYSLIGFVSGYS